MKRSESLTKKQCSILLSKDKSRRTKRCGHNKHYYKSKRKPKRKNEQKIDNLNLIYYRHLSMLESIISSSSALITESLSGIPTQD